MFSCQTSKLLHNPIPTGLIIKKTTILCHLLISQLVDQIRELTGGKGAYAAIDTVMGNRQGDILTKSLADKGKYIAVGFPHEHSHIKLDALDIIYRGIQVGWVISFFY